MLKKPNRVTKDDCSPEVWALIQNLEQELQKANERMCAAVGHSAIRHDMQGNSWCERCFKQIDFEE